MKKSLTISNKIFLVLCLVISMFFMSTFALLSNLTAKAAGQNFSSYYGVNTIKVENGDFAENEKVSDGLPYKPKTGWTETSDSASIDATYGVIDTNFEAFISPKNNKFGLEVNPGVDTDLTNPDEEILMIKAKDNPAKHGYVSDTIELKKAKFYVIEVHCKTGLLLNEEDPTSLTNKARASIYTTLSTSSADNFLNIDTNGYWETYNIYVATDTFNSSKFEIELRLGNKTDGSKGVVFFDQVAVKEIANLDFNSVVEDQNNIVINLDNDYANSFANNKFEDTLTSTWVLDENNETELTEIGAYSKDSINHFIKTNFDEANQNTDYANDFVFSNNKLLLMLNKEATASKVSSHKENTITIKQHGLYLLSMLVKTGNLSSGGLDVTLTEVVDEGEEAITTVQTGINCSSNTLPEYNGYKKVEFYIRGNAYFDKQVGITFELGKTDAKISGWAIIDNITLQQINQTEFSSKTSSTEFDLSKNITDTSTIKNGSFNFITNSQSTVSYPATPLNWTASENNTLSGVIRVADEYFIQDIANFGGLELSQNPGINTSYPQFGGIPTSKLFQYENVLMIRNNLTEDVDYTSDEFTISSNSSSNETYTKFQVGIKTVNTAKAYIKLINKNNQVLAVYDNISSNEKWTNYVVYIKNGITSQEIKLVLGTHGDGNNNYAFFDYVDYESDTKDDVLTNTNNSIYVNLLEDSFYSHSNTLVKPNVYKTQNYSVNAYEQNKESAVYNGIIDTTTDSSLKTRNESNDTNVLVVTNTVASYQNLISNYTYKLTKNGYYEFSVWIKTDFTNCENPEKYGAYFEIVTLDKDGNIVIDEKNENKNKFKNIVVTDEENNGWVKYSIYVLAEESDQEVKVVFGLGYAGSPTKGTAFFDDLKVVDIEKSEYTSKVANNTTIISKVITAETDEESSDKNENDSNNTTTPSDINIWALLSSIILVVALILAIAGYIIRRIPKKKLIKKVKDSEYNKSPKSVDEKEIKRELKVKREQKLEEINKQLEELKTTKEKLQTEYEETSNKEESQSAKEKLYTEHTKKINKLNKEIDYLSSAVTYISDETNIKISEQKEIKKRKKEVEQEFMRMKVEELEKEEAEPVEEPSKKGKGKK
ncbi:MAG: hypothetical protein IJB10_02890 [Clostridia bacterium]|nr:hypothetical protein [Clostridia bacterium]